MKLTATQFETLRWLHAIGGTCQAYRDKVVSAEYAQWHATWKSHGGQAPLLGEHAYEKPAVSALHLVQHGCIVALDGKLRITEKGMAQIRPFGATEA